MPKPSQVMLEEGFFDFKKQAGDGMCWVRGCQRKSKSDRCLCHMHEMRRWRAKNKRSADFCTLRDHAKARKIEFTITQDYWAGLTDAFGFYKAKEGVALSIDRVDPTRGYIPGNLRVVELSINVSKGNREKYLPEHIQHMLERKRQTMLEENEKYLSLDPPDTVDESLIPEEQPFDPDSDCPF